MLKIFDKRKTEKLKGIYLDLIVGFFLLCAELLVLAICWKNQGIQADESIYIYGALEMMKGKMIYRDFWVFYPPGIFVLVIWAFVLLGKSLFSLRLLLIIGAGISTIMLYSLGRTFMSRFYSAASCILSIAVGVNLWPVFGHHWTSTFAVIAAALFMAYFLKEGKSIFLTVSGLFVGAVLLLQLHKGIPLLAGGLFILIVKAVSTENGKTACEKEIVKPVVLFSLCSSLFPAITILSLAKFHLLREAWNAAAVFPYKQLAGIANPNYGAPYGAYTLPSLSRTIEFLKTPAVNAISARAVSALIIFIAPLSAAVLPIILLVKKTPRGGNEFAIPFFVSVTALSCFAASVGRPDFHHLLTALPPAFLTLGYCFYSIDFPDKVKRIFKYSGNVVFAAILVSAVWIGVGSIVLAFNTKVISLNSPLGFLVSPSRYGGETISLFPFERLLLHIKLTTGPNDKIFAMPASPFLYYLTDRENATRFPLLMSSLNDEAQMIEVVGELQRESPRIIIFDPLASWEQFHTALPYASREKFRRNYLLNYIFRNYEKREDYGGFVVLERVDDEETR